MTTLNKLSSMVSYELTERQWNECNRVALAILDKRKAGWKTDWHRGTFQQPHISTRVGLCGEIAFHQILRTYFKRIPYPDLSVNQRPSKIDFEWETPLGNKHEVKTTIQNPDGGVNYLREDVVDRADLYWFLATDSIDSRCFTLRGFATRKRVKTLGNIKKGRGKWSNYVLDTENLFPLSWFLSLKGDFNATFANSISHNVLFASDSEE